MPKSKNKKRKLTHAHPYNNHNRSSNTNGNQNLTHEEIWDDSALLRSWDEAVAEYEFYHSIHARGEDVDEVLKRYRAENGDDDDGKGQSDSADEGEIVEGDGEGEITTAGKQIEQHVADTSMAVESHLNDLISTVNEQINDAITSTSASPSASRPFTATTKAEEGVLNGHAQLATAAQAPSNPALQQDPINQTLENIKMAYYWAGYYSGLYDGQRQAQTLAQDQASAGTANVGTATNIKPDTSSENV